MGAYVVKSISQESPQLSCEVYGLHKAIESDISDNANFAYANVAPSARAAWTPEQPP